MTTRRNFLIATVAAPAIVRAESLMKIVVPSRQIITFDWPGGSVNSYSELVAMMEANYRSVREEITREAFRRWIANSTYGKVLGNPPSFTLTRPDFFIDPRKQQ